MFLEQCLFVVLIIISLSYPIDLIRLRGELLIGRRMDNKEKVFCKLVEARCELFPWLVLQKLASRVCSDIRP